MSIGKILFLAGLVLAALLAFVNIPYANLALVILGLVIGFMNVSAGETRTFLIAGIALISTNAAVSIGGLPVIGTYLSDILYNIGILMSPAVLVVAIKALLSTAGD